MNHINNLKTWSIRVVITLDRTGHPTSIHGLVLNSSSNGFNSEVTIKSKPNSSNDGNPCTSNLLMAEAIASSATN